MLKETLHFKDFNDQDRTTVVYFHLSESEIVDLVAATPEGIEKELDDALKANDASIILEFIKRFVHLSYGVKSQDGLKFSKSPEILKDFIDSPYYSDYLLGLIKDDGMKGQQFMRDILPPDLLERAEKKVRGEEVEPLQSHYAPSARETFANSRPSVSDHLAPKSNARITRENPEVEGANVPTQSAEEREFAEFQAWKKSQQGPDAVPGRVLPAEPHEQVG